jgi:hypothetical protein
MTTVAEPAAASMKPVRVAQAAPIPDGKTAGSNTSTDVISQRGYWQGLPSADPVEVRPSNARVMPSATEAVAAPARRTVATASVGSAPTGVARWPLADRQADAMPSALSYASQPTPIAAARALPMGNGAPRTASAVPGETTVIAKRGDDRLLDMAPQGVDQPTPMSSKKTGGVVRIGDRFNDPWMRAMIVSPSAQNFLDTTLLGMPDLRSLGSYLHKPAAALSVTFTSDPQSALPTDKFSGSALSFVSSVKFAPARSTASR